MHTNTRAQATTEFSSLHADLTKGGIRKHRGAAFLQRVAAVTVWAFAAADRSMERARQRYQLAEMDDRMLRDIGVTRIERHAETGKWPWQQ